MPLRDIEPEDIPEVQTLIGVPQPEGYAEADAFTHTKLALRQARELAPDDYALHFAVIVHDIGRGIGGHDDAGVELVKDVFRRRVSARDFPSFEAYEESLRLAVMLARFHELAHKADSLSPRTIRRLLRETGAVTEPELFGRFLVGCEADAKGHGGSAAKRPYKQARLLIRALRTEREVVTFEAMRGRIRAVVMAELAECQGGATPIEVHAIREAQAELVDVLRRVCHRTRSI